MTHLEPDDDFDEDAIERVHLELKYDKNLLIESHNEDSEGLLTEEIMFGVKDEKILVLEFDNANKMCIQSYCDKHQASTTPGR